MFSEDLGFVLHTRPYKETSLLVDFFSEKGCYRLLALGCKRGRAPTGRLLQLFSVVQLYWQGRGSLPKIVKVELLQAHKNIALPQQICGLYCNELIDKLLPKWDPHPKLYQAYQAVVLALQQDVATLVVQLRLFEKTLLDEIGYGLSLNTDLNGIDIDAHQHYSYVIEAGPCKQIVTGAVRLAGADLLDLATGKLSFNQANGAIKVLLRQVITHHLHGRVLHSRKLMANL